MKNLKAHLRASKIVYDKKDVLKHSHFTNIKFKAGDEIQKSILEKNIEYLATKQKIKQEISKESFNVRPSPTLLTFEFDNVYTGGRKVRKDQNLSQKIANFRTTGSEYYDLTRGGEITWHGKGQLVAYCILDLRCLSKTSLRHYIDNILLKSVINVLSKYNIKGFLNENPGVWVSKDQKISSIGCQVLRGITSYGISLNVNPDLDFLNTYEMCGLIDTNATSINNFQKEKKITVKEIADEYAKEISKLLEVSGVEKLNI